MDARQFPARPNLEQYKKQAKELLKACQASDAEAVRRIRRYRRTSAEASGSPPAEAKVVLADAQFVIAREHAFQSWHRFAGHIGHLTRERSPLSRFEAAADAIVAGDLPVLRSLLEEDSQLVHARSSRAHGAPLLHYVSANGVEDFRQKTPTNAVAIAQLLLEAGAEVDATTGVYGGRSTALELVASSVHPWRAGVQIGLLETLLAAGASVNGAAVGSRPLIAALRNGRREAAEFLATRGAGLDLEGAAGVGDLRAVQSFFRPDGTLRSPSTNIHMELGFLWACEYGRNNVVNYLLTKGIDPNRQANSGLTGLHWAVVGAQLATINLLLAQGASLEAKNVYGGTPLGQALWSAGNGDGAIDYAPVVQTLLAAGAKIEAVDYPTGNQKLDEVLRLYGAT